MAGNQSRDIALALILLTSLFGCTSAVAPESTSEPRASLTNTVIVPTVTAEATKTATASMTAQPTLSATRSSKADLSTPIRNVTRISSTPTVSTRVVKRGLEPELLKMKLYSSIEVKIAVGVTISDTLGHQTKVFALPNDATVSYFGGITSASWSRDGRRVLISHAARGLRSALKIVNDDGSDVRDITPSTTGVGYISYAIWSPDGKRVVFRSESDGQGCVFAMGSEGGQPRKLSRCEYQDRPLYWSEDGKYVIVYFTGQKNGPSASLDVLEVDGDLRIPLSQATGQYFDESYHPWRPINKQNCTGTIFTGVFNWSDFRYCK